MKVYNKTYNRDYIEIEKYEAGVMLTGAEAKSLANGNIKLDNAYVKIIDNEAYLINVEIPIYQYARPDNYDPTRMRKLLLHRKEIIRLKTKKKSAKLTIVPILCYNKGRKYKIVVALVKPRGDIGRKKLEKERDVKTAQKRELKEYLKK